MLEIGGSRQRINDGIGKTLGKKPAEARSKLFSCNTAGRARRIRAMEFEPSRPPAAEPLHFQDQSLRGLFPNAQDAPREVSLVGPQMHERRLSITPQFVVESRKSGQPFPVLADLDGSRSRQVTQSAV
jgi:hypothetical protein